MKIKNCPFCGSECKVEQTTFGDSNEVNYRVTCLDNEHALDEWQIDSDAAIINWNKRDTGTTDRKKARTILFKELEKSGYQWVLFNEEEPNRNNGIIECVLDAMSKFKN